MWPTGAPHYLPPCGGTPFQERRRFCAHWKHGNNVEEVEFGMKVLSEVGCSLQSGIG